MSRNGEAPTNGHSGGKDYFVDTKLVFRLKQFVSERRENGGVVTEDAAFDFLLDRFKEYIRKPQVRVVNKVHDSAQNVSREMEWGDTSQGVCVGTKKGHESAHVLQLLCVDDFQPQTTQWSISQEPCEPG